MGSRPCFGAGTTPILENLPGTLLMVDSKASSTLANLFLKLPKKFLLTGEVVVAFGIGCAIGLHLIF